MAELFGKATGVSGGRGGSMHLFDVAKSFMGGYAIVAGHMPLACGLALAEQYKGTERIVANFIGDGAVNEGEFHEALNLAAVWKLPVLFICENNLYGMGTAMRRVSAARRGLQARRGLRHRRRAGRRHGRARDARGGIARSRRSVRAGEGPRSWRRSATASAATRWPTPSSTATRTRSSTGASSTRSRSSARSSSPTKAHRRRRHSQRCRRDADAMAARGRALRRGEPEPAARIAHAARLQGARAMPEITYREALRQALR